MNRVTNFPIGERCWRFFCNNPVNKESGGLNFCTHCWAIARAHKLREYRKDQLNLINDFCNKTVVELNLNHINVVDGIVNLILHLGKGAEKKSLEYWINLEPIDRAFFEKYINAFDYCMVFPKLI